MKRIGRHLEVLAFVGPALLALAAVALLPIVYALLSSLFSWNLHRPAQRSFVGLLNYAELLQDDRFLNSLTVTLSYTALAVAATMLFGVVLALLLERPFPGKPIVRALLLIPMIMTPVASGLVWKVFFWEPQLGLVNWLLRSIGITGPAWLADSPSAFFAVVIIEVWWMTPFVMLVVDAALAGVPREAIEAAKIDGAGYLQRLWHITLPMIRVTLAFVLLFRLTTAFRAFDIIYITTSGGPGFDTQVVSLYIYNTALRVFDVGYANAAAVLMMLVVGALSAGVAVYSLRVGRERLGER